MYHVSCTAHLYYYTTIYKWQLFSYLWLFKLTGSRQEEYWILHVAAAVQMKPEDDFCWHLSLISKY